jgi:flavin-dependent dehydrogenase
VLSGPAGRVHDFNVTGGEQAVRSAGHHVLHRPSPEGLTASVAYRTHDPGIMSLGGAAGAVLTFGVVAMVTAVTAAMMAISAQPDSNDDDCATDDVS